MDLALQRGNSPAMGEGEDDSCSLDLASKRLKSGSDAAVLKMSVHPEEGFQACTAGSGKVERLGERPRRNWLAEFWNGTHKSGIIIFSNNTQQS